MSDASESANLERELDDAPEHERRALGVGALLGLIRGAIAALVGIVPLALFARVFLRSNDEELVFLAGYWMGACAMLGMTDALAARLGATRAAAVVRFIGGAAIPWAGLVPAISFAAAFRSQPPWESFGAYRLELAPFSIASLAIAAGQMLVESPSPGASREARMGRALRAATWSGAVAATGTMLVESDRASLCCLPLGWAAYCAPAYVATGLYLVGLRVGSPIARRLGRVLEPGQSGGDRLAIVAEHDRQIDGWLAARRAERLARDAESARAAREKMLDHARIAFELAVKEELLLSHRRKDATRLVGLLIDARLSELEHLLPDLPDAPALRAEVMRRRGDAQGAVDVARAHLAERDVPRNLRASFHAVLALALADLGRFDEARENLGELQRAERWQSALLEEHTARNVGAAIAKVEASRKEPRSS